MLINIVFVFLSVKGRIYKTLIILSFTIGKMITTFSHANNKNGFIYMENNLFQTSM